MTARERPGRTMGRVRALAVPPTLDLRLLGRFGLTVDGLEVELPPMSAKVVAFLGVHRWPVPRIELAQALWPAVDRHRALGNLRSALWRLPPAARPAVAERGSTVALAPGVRCDLDALDGEDRPSATPAVAEVVTWVFAGELLPGWYDEWVLAEREHVAVRRCTALVRLSASSCATARPAEAVLFAAVAVESQPLSEHPHQALLAAHVAQGNLVEAQRHLCQLEAMWERELGLRVSPQTRAIVELGVSAGAPEVAL